MIEWAAQASYEEPVTDIYVLASSTDIFPTNQELKIHTQIDSNYLLAINRWGSFTTNMIMLADYNIDIQLIGGNDEIAVSIITPSEFNFHNQAFNILYESKIVTNVSSKRLVCLIPVNELLPFIRKMKQSGAEIEHVFDY